ncbi:MAG: hypothetical protein IIX36_00225 [Clostridia bacterium]|nr:hypothetical protein [Clostridia bacterium]
MKKETSMQEQKNIIKKFSLEQIDELKFVLVIVKPSVEKNVIARLEELGGRVLMSRLGEGISKNKSLELFSHFDNPSLHLQLAHTMKQLCLGELKQKEDLFNFNLQLFR